MAEQIVTATVNEDGTFTVEGSGFKGKGCEKALKHFAEMGKVLSENKKPEYYMPEVSAGNNITVG